MGVQYLICYWAINRTDPQNLLSITLDIPLQKLYGLPKCVVSDCGPQFVASFTKELYRLLGIRLSSSMAWHPQTDRQTERINQELDQFLHLFVNEWQDDWWLVRPPIYHGVLAQQPHLLHNAATSIPTEHRTDSLYGLQAETEPLWSRDGQWIHREDEICHWRGQVSNPQGTGRHDMVLQSKEDSSPRVQTRRLGILRHVRHQNNTSVSEVVTSQTRTLQNRMPSRTVSLLFQVTPWNEAVAPSVQCRKVVCHSRRSNPRKKAASPAATHYCQQRRGVGGGRDIR